MNEPMFRRDDTRRFAAPALNAQPAAEPVTKSVLRLGWRRVAVAGA